MGWILGLQWALAQEKVSTISIAFENSSLKEVIGTIEEVSDYHFFYVEEWLGDHRVSGSYTDTSLDLVLHDIFERTIINFHILPGHKIVLTRNNIIRSDLPQVFYGKTEEPTLVEEVETNPVFYTEEYNSEKMETVRIGKESPNTRQGRFTLTGRVRNSGTGEFVSALAIVVKDKNIGTATDDNGFYKIELPAGPNLVETSAIGIQTSVRRVIIYNDGVLDLEVRESVEILDEVVVQADATKNVAEPITGVAQIEVEKIKTIPLVLGERDMLKVATTLPGITTAGEGAAGYNVRGGRIDQNLILLDNAVVYNPSHFFGIFSALNPFTTGTVNIYKGSIPVEYGGRLSSVFDIRTKEGNVEEFAGEASLGPVTSNLSLEVPIVKGKSSLLMGGRATYSQWILRSLKEESLKNSKASFYDVVARYDHKINDNNAIGVTGYFSNDAFNITSDSLYSYSNRLFSLRWNHKFSDKNTASLLLSNSQYRFNIEFDGNSQNDFDLGYKIDETEFKLKMRYLGGKGHSFDYGLSTKLYNVNPGSIEPLGPESILETRRIPKEKGLEAALFVSDDFDLSEKLSLSAGLRYSMFAALGPSVQRIYENDVPKTQETLLDTRTYDKNKVIKTYGGPEARLSARYYLRPDLSVKASFGNTFQYIHTLSNNTTASPTDTWKLSDSNIKPQRANQFSVGLYKNFDDNIYELSLESYFKKFTDIIDYKVGADLLLNEDIETEVFQGEGKAYGIELLLRKNRGKLNGWLGYTYSRSLIKFDSGFDEERINNGEYFPSNFDKPHDISLVANYKLTKRYSLSTNFVYQTGRPVTFPVGRYIYQGQNHVFYSERNEFRIPDYYRLDISINIEGNHKIKKFAHSFWNISVYNVLGRNNPYSVFFVSENGSIKAYKSSIFSIPVPTITYNFKF